MKMKLVSVVAAAALGGLYGCDGSDGASGMSAYQIAVANGFTGTEAEWLASLDPNSPQNHAAGVSPEQCVVCHAGFARGGDDHQAIYDDYVDNTLVADITGVASVSNGGTPETFTVTVSFSITKDGQPFIDANGLPTLEQKRFYVTGYDSANRFFDGASNFSFSASGVVSNGDGTYTVTKTDATYAPELTNALAYMYVADGPLDVGEFPPGGHYNLYSDVSNTGLPFGDANTYVSTANVAGCEKCHGAPYRKHGYRMAEVTNLPDFVACKACHYDDRTGGHLEWQHLVDDPEGFALGTPLTPAQEALYAYKATVMADTHMSHAMEFAYPQSMANCVTCHEGNIAAITDQSLFVAGTCKTCHPVNGVGGTDPHRAPSMAELWDASSSTAMHAALDMTNNMLDCTSCHNGTIADTFAELHSGYDDVAFEADGTKFADAITATIGTVTLAGNVLTIPFTVDGSTTNYDSVDAIPEVMVSFYSYDTKDFIVSNHTRDDNGLRMEFAIGVDADNALFTTVDGDGSDHTWEVTLDFGAFAATPSIPDMIASGVIRRAEIAVMPAVGHATRTFLPHGATVPVPFPLALNAPSLTFDLTTNLADPGFYPPIVDVAKCNACHESLGTTFHSADRGGNIVVCRMCHVTTSGGSHLELQSRSIDSYVHAIHSFQLFDPGDIDFTDPVEALHAEHHLNSTFPNFTLLNCESCHVAGMYNAVDQALSMPGVLSGTDTVAGRSIGDLDAVVTGPGARACGGCHRAEYINEDDAGGLAAFMQHTASNGYQAANEAGVFDIIFQKIMSYFY